MVFSSELFLFYFLPCWLLGYFVLDRMPLRWRNGWLAATGYVFYGWAEPRFILLMLATSLSDWLLGLVIAHDRWDVWRVWREKPVALEALTARSRRQRTALTLSVGVNLVALGFCKYFSFGVGTYNALAHAVGADAWQWDPGLYFLLPLGISFYTFQAIGYTVDVYRGEAAALESFVDFACFISMVPHLVAGPILKYSFLARQLRDRAVSLDGFARGVAFFLVGLAKKILLANACAPVADLAFAADVLPARDAWMGALAYTFQIYFDFSGYSDMAIGLGLMVGFVFAKNFDAPYRAQSITEFWQRWHMSLSHWLRSYVYIPLGGNRGGPWRTGGNLLCVMCLGGLWHGASWNFLLWGALHGVWLALERWHGRVPLWGRLPAGLRVACTFGVVLVGWVIFRAPTLPAAGRYLSAMAGLTGGTPSAALFEAIAARPFYLLSLLTCVATLWLGRTTWDWTQRLSPLKALACLGLGGMAIAMLFTQEIRPFIYFVF